MRRALFAALTVVALQGVVNSPASADVKYIPDAPGFIEITGTDYDRWRAGNLQPSTDRPHGACVTIPQGGCHCPNPNASGSVPMERRILLVARRVDRCPGIPSLATGTHGFSVGSYKAKLVITVTGHAVTGDSFWDCCPGKRKDTLTGGQINGTTIQFTRPCSGQGVTGQCVQVYTGTITGPNEASGTWTHNGKPAGNWSIP
jgi:hypothetical protein